LKNASAIARVVELQAKLPGATEAATYRTMMDIKLIKQEDAFGPMPTAAKLAYMQEVSVNGEIKDLYAKLQGTLSKEEANATFARLQVLQAKARYADPEAMLGLSDAATVSKIADLHNQMDPKDIAKCYRLSEEISLARFENMAGKVSDANKALFHAKAEQVATYKQLLWDYINATDKAKSDALVEKLNAQRKLVDHIDPELYLVAST
jgi:hypothetical protein